MQMFTLGRQLRVRLAACLFQQCSISTAIAEMDAGHVMHLGPVCALIIAHRPYILRAIGPFISSQYYSYFKI